MVRKRLFDFSFISSATSIVRINITLPTNYLEANKGYAAQQLARAGVRLAQLLDSVEWQ
jgi:hypothetical protein